MKRIILSKLQILNLYLEEEFSGNMVIPGLANTSSEMGLPADSLWDKVFFYYLQLQHWTKNAHQKGKICPENSKQNWGNKMVFLNYDKLDLQYTSSPDYNYKSMVVSGNKNDIWCSGN